MPKSKHRKNHKQKAQARKNRVQQEMYRAKKAQREFIEKIMELHQKKTQETTEELSFDLPTVPEVDLTSDGPII